MVKKRGLTIVAVFVAIFAGLNLYLFFNKQGPSYSSVSGMFIKEMPNLPMSIDISTVAFIVQWIILLAIAFAAYAKFLRHKNEEKITINYNELKHKKSKSGTDLDVLYNLLQNKKKVSIVTIARLFKITKEKALEWGKILENQELVIIEYPAFNDPEIKLNEKEKTGENEEKVSSKRNQNEEQGKEKELEDKKEKKILQGKKGKEENKKNKDSKSKEFSKVKKPK